MSLLTSLKFWIMIVDVVISSVLFFGAKYLPLAIDDIKFLVITLQPVILFVIGALTVENSAKIKSGLWK
jgi:hypothetical protein